MGNSFSAAPQGSDRPKLTQDEIEELPLVSHLVYATLSQHVYCDPDRRPLPEGWRVLMSCDEVHLDKEGYYAMAYVNDKMKHCVIAERGTSDALGIRAGVWMYFDEPTIQFALAEQFSKLVRLRLSLMQTKTIPAASSTGGFQLSYTGHSLGSVLAACRACAEHTFAVTFESPGAKLFVERTMHPFSGDDVDIITYLRPPNPLNSLKPHCGYLVQLPYTTVTNTGVKRDPPKKSGFAASLPNPQDYLRSKLLAASIPELTTYLSKIEPIIKELVEHTQQVHSISSIVEEFERDPLSLHHEPINQDVIIHWPVHIMQFMEYFNIARSMDDPANQQTHAYNAYKTLLERLYRTAKRNLYEIPLRFLKQDSRTLVQLWCVLPFSQLSELPLTPIEQRALNSISIEGDTLVSSVLTAFQMKQLLSLITQRQEVNRVLDNFSSAMGPQSKL